MFIFSFWACGMTDEVFLMNNIFFSVVYLIKMFRMWCSIIISHFSVEVFYTISIYFGYVT